MLTILSHNALYCQNQSLFANLVGYEVTSAYANDKRWCNCLFSDALPYPVPLYSPPVDNQVDDVAADGSGPIATSVPFQNDRTCYKFAKVSIISWMFKYMLLCQQLVHRFKPRRTTIY